MQELRFVAVSEDGSYAVLAVPGRSARFTLPIDERLRAVALGQTSRLAQYEIEVESPLRPKEIQARIRAGETVEQIADAAGIPVERVRWFEGPVLAERGYIADQAQTASVRRQGESTPGPRLGEIVTDRLRSAGIDPGDAEWDSRKRSDGSWQVALTFPSGGRLHTAEWVFDHRRRHASPDDDNASRLSLPEEEFTPPPLNAPGEATVTPLAPRLGVTAAAGGGAGGQSSASNQASAAVAASSRFRHERPSTPPPAPVSVPREPAAFSPPPPAPEADAPSASVIVEPEPELAPAPAAAAAPVAEPTPAPEPAPAPVASAPAAAAEPEPVAAAVKIEPTPVAAPTVAAPEPVAAPDVVPQPVPERPAPAPAESPAAKHEPAPAQPPAKPGPGGRQGSRKAKNRRSSVPSWDEIMLGSSREQE